MITNVREVDSPYRSSMEHLLAALNSIDLRVRWAVVRARANGLNPDNQFRGLFVTDEQIDQLLAHEVGHHVWSSVNGQTTDAMRRGLTEGETAVATARAEWVARTRDGFFRLQALIDEFELSDAEVDALLIAFAPEVDLRYERLYAFLQDDVTRKRPTVHLILNLLTTSFAEQLRLRTLFESNSRLVRFGLIECYGEDGQPLLSQFVRPTPRITAYLLENDGVDEAIERHARLHSAPFEVLAADYFSPALTQYLQQTAKRAPLFALRGKYGVGKWAAAQLIADAIDSDLLRIDVTTLHESDVGLYKGLQLALRDARLNQAVVYVAGWDTLLKDDKPPSAILHMLLTYPYCVITAGESQWQPIEREINRPILALTLTPPAFAERLTLWQRLTSADKLAKDVNLHNVATHFRFTPGQIIDAVATARDTATWRDEVIRQQDLLTASRFHSNQRLSSVAVKITPRYGWSDIILPADTLAQLHEAVAMVKQRPIVYEQWGFERKQSLGKGMNALFVGDPGTGKTMSAEIVANDLGLDLYKIDLSMMVSKYIGETEKNIGRVFDEATTSNAILFFDEADAIFGKRSEVKDSHDRHANIEVSYLLQRMETFDGVVILATNLRANIDEAFTRRLHFAIQFPFPDIEDRERIWRVTFPSETPLAANIDFSLLARRFRLAGGSIRNIVLASAFIAAQAGAAQVEMQHILHAARREHQKIGRLIKEHLFQWSGS